MSNDYNHSVLPGTYMHFKGGIYHVIGECTDEAGERLVAYFNKETGAAWLRPLGSFLSPTQLVGRYVPRFQLLQPHPTYVLVTDGEEQESQEIIPGCYVGDATSNEAYCACLCKAKHSETQEARYVCTTVYQEGQQFVAGRRLHVVTADFFTTRQRLSHLRLDLADHDDVPYYQTRYEQPTDMVDHRRLVSFLYQLLRDHLTAGVVDKLLAESPAMITTYSNRALAAYAQQLCDELTEFPNVDDHPLVYRMR